LNVEVSGYFENVGGFTNNSGANLTIGSNHRQRFVRQLRPSHQLRHA
jgi:hypothetical protein